MLKYLFTENLNTEIASNPKNRTRALIPFSNTMRKWDKNSYRKQNIFILWWGAGSEWWTDELRTKRAGIFIFRSSFYAIIDQHEIFDKKLPNWLHQKLLDLTIISVPDGYIAGVAYGIYQARYYFSVLLMVKLSFSTQFLIKRD